MNPNIEMTIYGSLPSGDGHSASMEGAVQVHFDDGDQLHNLTVRHDGTSLSTDGEDGAAMHKLMAYFESRGSSEDESHEKAWEVVREATRRMYQACKESDFTPDGLEKFAAV
jgi:hypothetical protein